MFHQWRNSVVKVSDVKCIVSLVAVFCFLFHFSLPNLSKNRLMIDAADSSFQELETVNSIDFEEAETHYSIGYFNEGFPLKISIVWLALFIAFNFQTFIKSIPFLLTDIPPPAL